MPSLQAHLLSLIARAYLKRWPVKDEAWTFKWNLHFHVGGIDIDSSDMIFHFRRSIRHAYSVMDILDVMLPNGIPADPSECILLPDV